MRKTETTLIDGIKYEVGHWPVDKALEIMTRLIKLLGEPLAHLIMGADKKKGEDVKSVLDREMNGEVISKALSGLAMRLDETEVKVLFREVTEGILANGKQIAYDAHFLGRIGHLMKVSVFCVRHQFADFLDVLPGAKDLGETPSGPNA